MKLWNIALAGILLVVSNSANAALVDLTFDVSIYSRHTASIGQGIPSANPVPAGTYIQWDNDVGYSGEQFQLTLRLDSTNMDIYSDVYTEGNDRNFARYNDPFMDNNSLSAQDANTYTSSIPTRRDDRFTFSRDEAPIDETSNEQLYMYNGSYGSERTRVGSDQINDYHTNTAYLSSNWYGVLRNQANFINTHDDFMALMDELLNSNTGFSFWHRAINSQSIQEDYFTSGNSQGIYTSLEGVRYQGSASLASISAVPVPAAVWLFGSGLIGLAGIARRKIA